MLYFVLYITVCFINCSVGNHIYYVIPTTGNEICPAGQVCHDISYYINFTFPPNGEITLIFLKGQHILHGPLKIDGLRSITFRGESQSTSDHHSLVLQSTINGNGKNSIEVRNNREFPTFVSVEKLTYNNGHLVLGRGFGHYRSLHNVYIDFLSLQNSTCHVTSDHITIINSIVNCMNCVSGLKLVIAPLMKANSLQIHNLTIQGVTNVLGTSPALYMICADIFARVSITDLTITNNDAIGIYIGGCHVDFGNTLISNNHSPYNGGGMWIDSGVIITSKHNTSISFINNTANGVGGAIYISEKYVVFHGRKCPCCGLKPIFKNNLAKVVGDNIYGGRFYYCRNNQCTFADISNCSQPSNVNAPYLNVFPKPLSSYITGDPLGVCICNRSVNCTIRSLNKQIYPGQLITLSLVTVGQCGGISPGVLLTESIGVDVVLLNTSQQTLKACTNFTYQIKQSNTTTSNESNIAISYKNTNHNILADRRSSLLINISFLQCPHGLQTGEISGVCECNDIINGISNTQCNISLMPHPITRSGNNWLHYNKQYSCTVAYEHCPFDYCITSTVSLNLNESDLQCTYNRSGTLCGQCQPGLSLMLGSNQCGHCSNYYLFLLPLFIIAGIGLIFMLLALNLTVSVGTINGLLFYANILKLNEPVLFPNISIPVLTQFISWLNLDFGFNVCFFHGLDGYWKTWMQFAFPLYIWILIASVIIGCHYSGKLSRLCGNNAVPVLATLILMSFTKIVSNITNVLMISKIKCEDFHWDVWIVDGNIEYLSGKHIPLFVISILFLLTGLIYTIIIFCSQWLQQYGGKYCSSRFDPYVRLKPFVDSYTGPYKDKYRFWTGLLLIVRLIVTAVFAYTTGSLNQVNNYITVLVCIVLLYFVRGKYKDKSNTLLESFYLSNLCFTSLLNAVSDHVGFKIKVYINGVSIGLSIVVFTVIIIYHVYVLVTKKYTIKLMRNIRQQDSADQKPLLKECSSEEEMNSPAHIINRRESLIFDFKVI